MKADGLEIRARLTGSGRPLMLINGIGCNLETWAPLLRRLRGLQVLSFDAPGTGGSEGPAWPMRVAGHARVAAALASEIGWSSYDVLGLSWGGTVAQELAHLHPERVRRLILCATTFGIGGYSANPLVTALMSSPFRHSSATVAQAVAPALYAEDVRMNPGGYADFIRRKGTPSLAAYYRQVYALSGWSSLPWLRRLTMPTLVLAGQRDQVVPARNARVLATCIPRSTLRFVPGGHLFLLLGPEKPAGAIREFLLEDEPAEMAVTA